MTGKWLVVPLLGLTLLICGCQGLQPAPAGGGGGGVTTGGGTPASLQSINHIVFMLQENRSFDSYFGQLPAYWQANGLPRAAVRWAASRIFQSRVSTGLAPSAPIICKLSVLLT